MWLYMIAAVLLVVGIVGGVLTGGIFLIIFIPLGIIALITAIATGALARGAEKRSGAAAGRSQPGASTLPHSPPEPTGHVTTSPEALVDARRQQQ
jgi:hypothetical protein